MILGHGLFNGNVLAITIQNFLTCVCVCVGGDHESKLLWLPAQVVGRPSILLYYKVLHPGVDTFICLFSHS